MYNSVRAGFVGTLFGIYEYCGLRHLQLHHQKFYYTSTHYLYSNSLYYVRENSVWCVAWSLWDHTFDVAEDTPSFSTKYVLCSARYMTSPMCDLSPVHPAGYPKWPPFLTPLTCKERQVKVVHRRPKSKTWQANHPREVVTKPPFEPTLKTN